MTAKALRCLCTATISPITRFGCRAGETSAETPPRSIAAGPSISALRYGSGKSKNSMFRVLAFTIGAIWAVTADAEVEEYQLKAAVVYNFAKFVEWPPQSFTSASDPIAVCILGQNPFGRWLTETLAGRTVGGRPFVIRRASEPQEVGHCQILFVCSSERKRFRVILADVKADGVLTVGDTPGFAALGGVVNLRLDGETVRMEVNLESAKQKKLQISAKLLSLAQIVK